MVAVHARGCVVDHTNAFGEFALRYVLPVFHRQALLALCAKIGWAKEGSLPALFVNIG